MKTYMQFVKKSFQNNIVYKLDYYVGVVNTILIIFANLAIWKAIYEEEATSEVLEFRIMATYIVLAFLMQCIYVMDEYLIESKVRSGLISTDLIKPLSFRLSILSYNAGTLVFRMMMQLTPALILSIILFKPLPPFTFSMFILFLVSALLGYLVLYNLNFIVWISSFWFYRTFSLVTIKDALIMILSGAILPIWFMPQWLQDLISKTPFDSIYYIPISIYLGQVPSDEIIATILKQVIWVIILFITGQLVWTNAKRKLVVQGG